MVARPASQPVWSTDANFTNGGTGIAGTPTKVAPSSGVQNEGNVPGTPLPAQRLNWWQNLTYQWTSFLGETGIARTKVIPISEFVLGQNPSTGVNQWIAEGSGAFGNAPRARPIVDHAFASVMLSPGIPLGATISKIELIVSADSSRATSTDQWQIRAFKRLWTWGVTPTATLTEIGTGPYGDGTGTGLRVITISGLAETVVVDTDYPLWVQGPNSHGASDHLLACRVTYTAPRVAD